MEWGRVRDASCGSLKLLPVCLRVFIEELSLLTTLEAAKHQLKRLQVRFTLLQKSFLFSKLFVYINFQPYTFGALLRD